MDLGLEEKVALVTGGGRGLGEAICRRLAAEGAHVVVNYSRSAAAAERLAADLAESCRVKAIAAAGDISLEEDVARLFRRAADELSRIDILVNNAGVCPPCLVREMSEEVWSRTIAVNLTGAFLASREMVRHLMARRSGGRIINIVSPAAFLGSASGKSHYAASKAGLVALTVSLAREVAAEGILVNAVAPGMLLTDMTAETLKEAEDRYRRSIPLGRIGRAEEVADVVAFLASERCGYMTGATVDVSGGLLMR